MRVEQPAASNVGEWDRIYEKESEARTMGMVTTYRDAVSFLDLPDVSIEDWGGGKGKAREFLQVATDYRVVDGSGHLELDAHGIPAQEYKDLCWYKSDPPVDCILIRHVLEHNEQWRMILSNALESFTRRLVIVTFTPFSTTGQTEIYHNSIHPAWVERSLPREEIEEAIEKYHYDYTITPYGKYEHIIRIANDGSLL